MDKKICPECGTENEQEYIYCKNCGTPLDCKKAEPAENADGRFASDENKPEIRRQRKRPRNRRAATGITVRRTPRIRLPCIQ